MIKKTALKFLWAFLITMLACPLSSQAATRLNGKKVIFIGNSFLYYGGCTSKGKQRQEDSGLFKRICELYGDNVTVTDCTYGNHGLDDFSTSGCKASNCSSGTGCSGNGSDLLRELDLSSYDIVFFSEAGENPSGFWSRWTTLKKRFTKPTVEFYYLSHTHTYIKNHYYIVNNFDNFEAGGVKVLEWGRIATELYGGNTAPGNMTPERKGKLTIPNSAVTYSKTSFIKNKNDTHHPNPLSGYMTALMAYCAASQTLAQGMRYDFVNDVINIDNYISSHYSSSSSTNMKKIFASEADMQGLQALMDICIQHGIFDYDVKYDGFYFKVDDVAKVTCERYTKLTGDLVIPSSVTYESANYVTKEITPYAFYAHSGLKSIVIPETIETVGNHAFQGCTSLASVTCLAKIPATMPDDAFTTYETTTLYVPAGTKEAYASAPGWRNFANIVAEGDDEIDPDSPSQPAELDDKNIILTENWKKTTTADWFSAASPITRHIEYYNGKLYVVSNDPTIKVVNAYTGVQEGTMSVDGVTGGAISLSNLVAFDGKFFGSNRTSNSETAASGVLKIYRWDSETSAPTLVKEVTAAERKVDNVVLKMGGQMSFSGNLTNGRVWFAEGSTVIYMDITNGAFGTPQKISLTKNGSAYAVSSMNGECAVHVESDGSFWVDGNSIIPAHFSATGAWIEDMASIVNVSATSYRFFNYGSRKLAVATTYLNKTAPTKSLSNGAFVLADVADGAANATAIATYPSEGFPTPSDTERNDSFITSICQSTDRENGAVLDVWVNIPEQGVAHYTYNGLKASGIEDVEIAEDEEVAPVEYYNLQGVKVANPENGLYIRVQGNKATKVLIK